MEYPRGAGHSEAGGQIETLAAVFSFYEYRKIRLLNLYVIRRIDDVDDQQQRAGSAEGPMLAFAEVAPTTLKKAANAVDELDL